MDIETVDEYWHKWLVSAGTPDEGAAYDMFRLAYLAYQQATGKRYASPNSPYRETPQ